MSLSKFDYTNGRLNYFTRPMELSFLKVLYGCYYRITMKTIENLNLFFNENKINKKLLMFGGSEEMASGIAFCFFEILKNTSDCTNNMEKYSIDYIPLIIHAPDGDNGPADMKLIQYNKGKYLILLAENRDCCSGQTCHNDWDYLDGYEEIGSIPVENGPGSNLYFHVYKIKEKGSDEDESDEDESDEDKCEDAPV
jgi:hypothetical protein